jgi:predicted membrane-bound spermidine synthase
MLGMMRGRRLVGGIGVVAGAGLIGVGFSLAAVTQDVFGDSWHPHGSLALAVIAAGIAVLLSGGWTAVASPSAWRGPWRFMDTPGRLGLVGGLLIVAAIVVFAITDQVGGAIAYSPFDWLGLEMLALAAVVLFRAGWGIAAAHPPRRQ